MWERAMLAELRHPQVNSAILYEDNKLTTIAMTIARKQNI